MKRRRRVSSGSEIVIRKVIIPKQKFNPPPIDRTASTKVIVKRFPLLVPEPIKPTKWQKSSRILQKFDNIINPMCWSVNAVADFIEAIPNCAEFGEIFRMNEIDGDALLSMHQEDMIKYMNIKLGPAVKIYNQIRKLRQEVTLKFVEI